MTDSDILRVDRDQNLVVMTMNRYPANALSMDLVLQILDGFRAFAAEQQAPGIVMTGAGDRFFSAGGDINEVAGLEFAAQRLRTFHALLCEMERYPAPVVCAVRGYAVGGAFELLLHSDYVVANTECRVGFPEINHGLLPVAKGMRQASRKLGHRAAQNLLYSGELIDSEKAIGIHAIDEVVDTGVVTERAASVCRHLASKDKRLFSAIKRTLNVTMQMGDEALEMMTLEDLHEYLDRREAAEARAQFLSRSPKRR